MYINIPTHGSHTSHSYTFALAVHNELITISGMPGHDNTDTWNAKISAALHDKYCTICVWGCVIHLSLITPWIWYCQIPIQLDRQNGA